MKFHFHVPMYFYLLLLLMFLPVSTIGAAQSQTREYTIAVIPSAPVVTMHTQWTPFLERLNVATGQRFTLRLFDRMPDFERAIGEGTADFILASPIQTVVAYQLHRYEPLVRGGQAVSIGLFVRADSSVKTIDDLNGKIISFVGNKNFCSVFIRHILIDRPQPLSFESSYSGSTRNVIKSVILGKSAAGAVFIPEFEREPEENRRQLHSITETRKVAPHPLAAHPRVSRELRDKVKKVVLEMNHDAAGANLLKTIRLPAPVAADYDRDYRELELMDIKKLTDWGN